MAWAEAVDDAALLVNRLCDRLMDVKRATDSDEFVVPVGFFFVVDEANGGNATAVELQKRFHLLDFESANAIDFYFLGWGHVIGNDIAFSLDGFRRFRQIFRHFGVKGFGGNADLVLTDAICHKGVKSCGPLFRMNVKLDFSSAIHLDLARMVKQGTFSTLGECLQSIIVVADHVRRSSRSQSSRSSVSAMSDELGINAAKESLLSFFLDKWGKFIGAKHLRALVTKNLGPPVELDALFDHICETHQITRRNYWLPDHSFERSICAIRSNKSDAGDGK